MVIHFICRGNSFRSIIAEAYLNSLRIPGLTVVSSGTVASEYKTENAKSARKTLELLKRHGIEEYAKDHYADDTNQEILDQSDIVVCLNKIVYAEASAMCALPHEMRVWEVADLGEEGRIATSEEDRKRFSEDVYAEIVKHVDSLVAECRLRG